MSVEFSHSDIHRAWTKTGSSVLRFSNERLARDRGRRRVGSTALAFRCPC